MIDMNILKKTPAYWTLWRTAHENIEFDADEHLRKVIRENDHPVVYILLAIGISLEILYVYLGCFNAVSKWVMGFFGTACEPIGIICAALVMIVMFCSVFAGYFIAAQIFGKVVCPNLIKAVMFICIVKDLKYWNEQMDKYIRCRAPELATEIDNFIKGGLRTSR